MQKHTKIYMRYFGYGIDDFIPCEVCGARCVDIHHLEGRGKDKDRIELLIGLCRKCHDKAHNSNREFNERLKEIHLKRLQTL